MAVPKLLSVTLTPSRSKCECDRSVCGSLLFFTSKIVICGWCYGAVELPQAPEEPKPPTLQERLAAFKALKEKIRSL